MDHLTKSTPGVPSLAQLLAVLLITTDGCTTGGCTTGYIISCTTDCTTGGCTTDDCTTGCTTVQALIWDLVLQLLMF